jgi:hypothetical protein
LNKLEEVVSGIPPLDIDILVAVKRSWGCREGGLSIIAFGNLFYPQNVR